MSIRKDVTVKITNNNATLDMPLQIYELDHGIELRFKLMDYKYKYTKDPQNILNSSDEDILEAYTTIINPRGYELQQINGEVKDDIVIFMIDSSYTDEIDEIGTYSLQIHIKCACSEFSIPPIQFEVLQRLKGIKVVTDGEDSIDDSALIDNYSNFISDETGKLLIEWKKGDIISSVKLNAMVEVINNAVDEEVQRQLNEVKREQQELERQNKVREALNSVDARVDEAMIEYETRFNALTVSQQQDMEVIDARDGEISLKARLDRDVRNPLQVYEDVEGSFISCDSTEGYAQNVEILGNTIQNQDNLADIRSVGDKVEGKELYEIPVLSTGKNLINVNDVIVNEGVNTSTGKFGVDSSRSRTPYIKFNPNTNYVTTNVDVLLFYDENKQFISSNRYSTGVSPSNCKYVVVRMLNTTTNWQLEEGIQATPYEPYKEHKLTILSPVQLEKVGDVADRIICKDGVWGVEKNIETFTFNGSENWQYNVNSDDNLTNTIRLNVKLKTAGIETVSIMKNFKYLTKTSVDEEGHAVKNSGLSVYIRINKTRLLTVDADGFKQYLNSNPVTIYYQTTQPQFIPLPHDQQIKLRTFANKTNISFECEIEPILKASVPKTIGASVNSHSEQIDNLGKEIDNINNEIDNINSEIGNINTDLTNLTESIEGSYVSVDSKEGYLKDIEIIGNTVQDQNNLADIRSVGDKLENKELYEIPVLSYGKNVLSEDYRDGINTELSTYRGYKLKLDPTKTYVGTIKYKTSSIPTGTLAISPLVNPNHINDKCPGKVFACFFNGSANKRTITITHKNMQDDGTCYLTLYPDIINPSVDEYNDYIEQYIENIQLEEGTTATPYEPYQEHKLTILSPVQLEKVGDVADRIICKDDVWGVEKNIENVTFDGSEAWVINKDGTNTSIFSLAKDGVINRDNDEIYCISDKFVSFGADYQWINESESISVNKNGRILIRIFKEKLTTNDSKGFKEWLQQNNICVKYLLAQPQFIPLPHDQQIKLRTFADKTNIHFLTEIEPTLKASVPKSLSATVSTHTEQIDNLGKELDKVKKLEESTVSTFTTESSFTTVTETSNGYFEDVKIEGRTLVNLAKTTNYNIANRVTDMNIPIKENCEYTVYGDFTKLGQHSQCVLCCTSTVYLDSKPNNGDDLYTKTVEGGKGSQWSVILGTDKCIKIIPKTGEKYMHIRTGGTTNGVGFSNLVILEGDHTQNPPEYFEGIKSVGQDVDEISVASVKGDGNLCEGNELNISIKNGASGTFSKDIVFRPTSDLVAYFVDCEGGQLNNENVAFRFLDKSKNILGTPNYTPTNLPNYNFKFSDRGIKYSDVYYLKVFWNDKVGKDVMISNLTFISGNVAPTKHITHKQDKKRILYYNPTTETWDKPVLKEWDSIEKHSDGKYYYHKRSGEVVLDGSENWRIRPDVTDDGVHVLFSVFTSFKFNKSSYMICDKFNPKSVTGANEAYSNGEGIAYYNYSDNSEYAIYYVISKSKLTSQDTQGFAQWLQANPTTLVYQLETEEVYECTSIDLITYENETNFIVNAGAIAPISTLKVMCNINNVVRELQQKVLNLENYIQHVMIDALNNALNE